MIASSPSQPAPPRIGYGHRGGGMIAATRTSQDLCCQLPCPNPPRVDTTTEVPQ
jgi:hypothetical protein